MQRLDEAIRAERRERRGFEYYSVSGDESGREFPCGNRARKIPRRDQRDHAEWFANRVADYVVAFGRNLIGELARAFATEVAKDIDGAFYFAERFGQCLAFFARHFL